MLTLPQFRKSIYQITKKIKNISQFINELTFHGALKNSCVPINIILILCCTSYGRRGMQIFSIKKLDILLSLFESVKVQICWWLRVYYVLFDRDYLTLRMHPFSCFKVVSKLFAPFCCLGNVVVYCNSLILSYLWYNLC